VTLVIVALSGRTDARRRDADCKGISLDSTGATHGQDRHTGPVWHGRPILWDGNVLVSEFKNSNHYWHTQRPGGDRWGDTGSGYNRDLCRGGTPAQVCGYADLWHPERGEVGFEISDLRGGGVVGIVWRGDERPAWAGRAPPSGFACHLPRNSAGYGRTEGGGCRGLETGGGAALHPRLLKLTPSGSGVGGGGF
jgi:hypothetical protein